MAVGFHQQHSLAVGRQADVRVVLDAARGHAIEELQRARDDARRDDRRDGFRRVLDRVVQREHRPARRRPRHELEQHFGDDAERAFRANKQILERVSGDVLHARAAQPRDSTVSEHDLESHHVVARHAVLQAAQAAGVLGDVAADRADALASRDQADKTGRVSPLPRRCACVMAPGCARSVRLRGSTSRIAIHLRQAQDEAVLLGHAAAAQPGARAARDDRRATRGCQSHALGNLLGRPREARPPTDAYLSAAVPSKLYGIRSSGARQNRRRRRRWRQSPSRS